jgi:signal transduction histidine kinase
MTFKVMARTLVHLGAELISSDAVALYELVKNAFDAGSPRATIAISFYTPIETLDAMLRELNDQISKSGPGAIITSHWRQRTATIVTQLSEEVGREIREAQTLKALRDAVAASNSIEVSDTGHGMSLQDLVDVYLTVGTPIRMLEKETRRVAGDRQKRPILGEKGVGRLAAMRLGRRMKVATTRCGDPNWYVLDVDWSLFSHASEKLLSEIEIEPFVGQSKNDRSVSGTHIILTELASDWDRSKLQHIANEEFSRLTDPFEPKARYPIDLSFNGVDVLIPNFQRDLLNAAHATMHVSFSVTPHGAKANRSGNPEAHLKGRIDYRLHRRSRPIDISGDHLVALAKSSRHVLANLGPFTMELYWFNRPLLERIESIGEPKRVKDLVNQWSGGLMLYRDGFRVGGYGSGADDWLKLDPKAFASGGYKLNRSQMIGRVSISSDLNPPLIDQTNREGLKDSPEKDALRNILMNLIQNQFRPFLNRVDEDVQAREPINLAEVLERVASQRKRVMSTLRALYQRYPAVKRDREISGQIEEALRTIAELSQTLRTMEETYSQGRRQMVVLAGVGLTVSAVAHELNRATADALSSLDRLRRRRSIENPATTLGPLTAQLKTLLTRLRVLDPLVTSGRQVPQDLDLNTWLPPVVEVSAEPARRDGIDVAVRVIEARTPFRVRVVPGMMVQIVENIVSNAQYWLTRKSQEGDQYKCRLGIDIDAVSREVRFSDNGPGVEPSMRESIFEAFVTTKPVGDGTGLGLFISREIAHYAGGDLILAATPVAGYTTTFALHFPPASK